MSNIIFLMADQLRFDLLQAYGDQQCDTPHLDALANQSTVFEHHYTVCPLCVPARSSLMTGLYPRQHGAIINGWFPEEREHGTVNAGLDLIPNRIAAQGYDVYHAGIQHVRTAGGFDANCPDVKFLGPTSVGSHHRALHKRGLMLPDMTVFRDPVLEHAEGQSRVTSGTSARTAVWPLREDLFYDSVITQKMVNAIQEHDDSKPLCLYGMFWLPHPRCGRRANGRTCITPTTSACPTRLANGIRACPHSSLQTLPANSDRMSPSNTGHTSGRCTWG